ncbi:MAG TPA: hypothetical protein PL124_11065 [Candidatus Cloacimonadota bacterium]|nr:hypothetical protein [Candidatus Cloacimonadota bacterium]
MAYDLNEVPDGDYIATPGKQDLCITKVEESIISQQKGTPGFRITLANAAGQTIRDTFWEVKNAMFRIKLLAKACQLPESEMAVFEPSMVLGHTVTCNIVPDGPEYFKVSKYEATGNIVIPPEDKDDAPF